ncbi:MAG: transglutaminase-like domain-containing protein [Eubacteriales bacterium]|nr:transglutaminase-like domain-containing protein [Eubacteriales bacterium]
MKRSVKFISLLLCFVMVVTSLPLTAFASLDTVQNLRYEYNVEWDEYKLVWDKVNNYDCYNVYMSSDGVNYSALDTVYGEYCYLPYNFTKGVYSFYVTAYTEEWYDYLWDSENQRYYPVYHPAQESSPSNTVSIPIYKNVTSDCYAYIENGKLEIHWSSYGDEVNMIDGFQIYQSKNGGEFTPIAQFPVNSGTPNNFGGYSYEYNASISKSPASYKFVVASYTVLNGVMYSSPDFSIYDECTVYMPAPVLTTKTKSETIKWKKVSGADSYAIYGGTSYSKMKKLAVVGGSKTSYTVKNVDNYKKDYYYYICALAGGAVIGTSYSASSGDSDARMRAAKVSKKKKNTVTVWNTRPAKSSKAWTVTISKKDRKILSDFAKKHFKKGWSNAQKAQYTLNWINKNVSYAYGSKYSKIAKCSYVEAIFKKKCGQCLQYNGAYAMFLTYLGYEARIIQGWRGYSMKNKWSHYWCEIKIDGKWYLMETGNYQDSGDWMYFCEPYRNTRGYLINKKVAK